MYGGDGGGGSSGGENGGDGGVGGGAGGAGGIGGVEGGVGATHILNPATLYAILEAQLIEVATTPSGPFVPQYLAPSTVTEGSHW